MSETDTANAQLKSQLLEADLFEIRDRIMDITIKFDKSDRKLDLERGKGKEKWKGAEDVDKLCSLFVNFLTTDKFDVTSKSSTVENR